MISNSSAAYPASWWQLTLMAIVLFGLILFLIGETFSFLRWFILGVGSLFRPRTYQDAYITAQSAPGPDGEHRDPTRPRAWDDIEGKVIVAERMRHLDRHKGHK